MLILADVNDYVRWVRDEALPVWAEIGFDRETGRFHERLDLAGRPLAVPHRAMVQARQVFVYAQAARLGWFADGGEMAERAMHGLLGTFAETSGDLTSFAFSIDPGTRSRVSAKRDSYSHAFILFALAHLYALTGDRALLDTAERTTRFVERHLLDPIHGGVIDDDMDRGATKRQNPQMHLLEAYLALHEVAPGSGYAERADGLVALFYDKMSHAEHGVLVEHFAHDWTPHPAPEKAHRFEPGHHYEWIWLLRRHERIGQGIDHGTWRERLHTSAHEHGLTPASLIYDELSADKTEVRTSHRLWPHTEAIKAATVHHADGDARGRPFADAMADTLLRHFLSGPFAGGWIDHVSADLAPLVDYVPASSLYHLFLAATEADVHWGHLPETAGTAVERLG